MRGRPLWGVFGAPWGRLESVWGVVSASPKRQTPSVLRWFLALSCFGPCNHANGCSSGACGQHGSSGKQLAKVFGAPRGESGAPTTSRGRFGSVLAAVGGDVERFSLTKKCPKPNVLRWLLAFSCFGYVCLRKDLLRALGSDLGGLGSLLGASWGLLGASWGVLGASWVRLGDAWGASWGHPGGLLGQLLGPKTRLGGLLGPIFGTESVFYTFSKARKPQNPVKPEKQETGNVFIWNVFVRFASVCGRVGTFWAAWQA